MNKQAKQYIILGVLGVVFVGYVLYAFVLKGGPASNYQTPNMKNTAASAPDKSGSTGSASAAPGGQTKLETDEINIDALLQDIKEVSFDYDAVREARNPMTPLVGKRFQVETQGNSKMTGSRLMQKARSMILTGIIWDKAHPLAVLNNEVVGEGHVFDADKNSPGIVVDRIEQGRVILKVDEQLVPLNLEEQ